jgi:rRNA maturation RNase YbeY
LKKRTTATSSRRSSPKLSRKTAQLFISTEFPAKKIKIFGSIREFQDLFGKILSAERRLPQNLELQFVRSKTMRKLNFQFRGKNKPTDVLSFPSISPTLLGSIVIDCDTATKQAKEFGHSLKQEVFELFIHGILHLLGFDHEKKRDAERMKKEEMRFNRFIKKSKSEARQ